MPGVKTTKKRKRDKESSSRTIQKRPRSDKARKPASAEKIIDIPEQSRQVELQDQEFFQGDEFGDYTFLKSLDASQLGKRITKDKLPRDEKTTKPAKKVLPEVHETSHDEYSDEEDLSDVVNDALDGNDVEKHQWDQEQAYEQQPRKGDSQWRKKESSRLPVRTVTGKLRELEASDSESESSDETEESDSDSDTVVVEEPIEEIVKVGKEAVIQVKETLAKLAGEILEEPQEKVSNLKTFRELFNKGNLTIQKLALVTQFTVYKDIIPGYRIRELSDVEKTAKVTKEVKQLRAFEQSILLNYKAFISSLVTIIKSAQTNQTKKSLSDVAVTCATSLLIAVPHFNFRTELLKIVVARVSRQTADDAFIKCRRALETLFTEDEEGRAGLEAVSMISKMLKTRRYQVHPSLIQSLLHLRLLNELGVKASTDSVDNPRLKKKNRSFRTKKERKEFKERKKVEMEFAEADAQVSAEERERLQSETLKIVFSLYFRILKETHDDGMLSVVLDGIAKFARLINAEFFGDLLEVLREILEAWDDDDTSTKSGRNTLREELTCLNTAFTLLANQGGSNNIDLSFFVQRFYDLLPLLCLSPNLLVKPSPEEKPLIELTVKILDSILFNAPTPPSPARIFMFFKRLLTCSLQMEEKEGMIIFKVLQRIKGRFEKKVEGMWDQEGAGVGDAGFGRGVRGWEVGLLDKYYYSNMHQMGRALLKSGVAE